MTPAVLIDDVFVLVQLVYDKSSIFDGLFIDMRVVCCSASERDKLFGGATASEPERQSQGSYLSRNRTTQVPERGWWLPSCRWIT
jgi:hypothetical protein